MSSDPSRRWCLFTCAGDRNAVRRWTEHDGPRPWDLIVAYYGDDDAAFAALSARADRAVRMKGGKFQNLKKLVDAEPGLLGRYEHVWVCDDDLVMSRAQIDEAFALAAMLGVWVAQPAFRPEGKISYWINCCAAPQWDYRIVNYVEVTAPIFRRDKLDAFLTVYDGSLTGWGIDYWYANLFEADAVGRFAVIDKVAVLNPRDEDKGGREIDRLQPLAERRAAWEAVRARHGMVEYPHKVFAYGKLSSDPALPGAMRPLHEFPPALQTILAWLEARRPAGWREAHQCLRDLGDDVLWQIAVFLARGAGALERQGWNKFHRAAPPPIAIMQHTAAYRVTEAELRAFGATAARTIGIDSVPTFAITYGEQGTVSNVRFGRFDAPAQAQATRGDPTAMRSTGRNDLCPCGSGKKFKHCHGRAAS